MPPNSHQTNPPTVHHPAHQPPKRRKHIDWAGRSIRIELFIVIVGSALLLAATSLYLALNGGINTESKRVEKDKYQAVFINGISTSNGYKEGSLYFGRISALNDRYLVLNDVYYITSSGATGDNAAAQSQLTKLGCEVHAPFDELVINRSQVAFWENLKDSGQVVKFIKEFKTKNPKGPNCDQQAPASQNTAPQGTNPTP